MGKVRFGLSVRSPAWRASVPCTATVSDSDKSVFTSLSEDRHTALTNLGAGVCRLAQGVSRGGKLGPASLHNQWQLGIFRGHVDSNVLKTPPPPINLPATKFVPPCVVPKKMPPEEHCAGATPALWRLRTTQSDLQDLLCSRRTVPHGGRREPTLLASCDGYNLA